jgi:hypothetical protein
MRSRAWSIVDNRVMRGLSIAALVLLAACSTVSPPKRCTAGEETALMDTLFVGTKIPSGGEVTTEQWQTFLAEVATPRFPKGFTSWPTVGQWQDASGRIWTENGYALQIVHPVSEQDETAVLEVMSMYKSRFRQDAVMRVRSSTCMSFR